MATRLLLGPPLVWLCIFLLAPLVAIIVFSFWRYTGYGMVPALTGENFAEFFTSPVNISVFLETLKYTGVTVGIAAVLGYAIAYFLNFHIQETRYQLFFFLLCVVPFWTSGLIRSIAWLPVLGKDGVINTFLETAGLIDQPLEFLLFSKFSVYIALVQLYTLLMIGPIFFMLAKIDKSFVEAASDLGASPFHIFWRIIFPLSVPGLAIGCIFVFVLTMGEFAANFIISGNKVAFVGNVIVTNFGMLKWPAAAVNAIMLIAVMVAGVVAILRVVDIRREL